MAITQQLQTESTSFLGPGTQTLSVTLGAGSNRLFLVALLVDSFGNPEMGIPSSIAYDGIPMDLVTDGVSVAQSVRSSNSGPGTGTTMAAFWYVLRESQLPANGAHNVAVTTVGSGGGAAISCFGVWILEGCVQSALVRSVANASTNIPDNAPSLTAIVAHGDPSDAVLVAGCNDNSAGTIQITIGGVSLTEDFDIDQNASSRAAAGTDLTAPSAGPIGCTMAYTTASTQRAAISAIRLKAFSIPIPGSVIFSRENHPMSNEYPFGQSVRLRASFANALGVGTNPTTTFFEFGLVTVNPPPDPAATVAIFGIDSAVTNPTVGTFLYDLLPTQSGNYIARVVGTGAVQAAQVLRFRVLTNPFA